MGAWCSHAAVRSSLIIAVAHLRSWPSLEPSEFRFDIPCPRCTVCLEYAVELVEEIIEEMLGDTDDDEEEEEEDEEE